jgi:hypothetical protein
MSLSFDRVSDEMPEGRDKYNHAQGTVGQVSWENIGNHPYTGIFASGSSNAVIRLSEGNLLIPEATGLTPTMGLKLLRDGMPSVNIVANTSFEPLSSFNFFSANFHTHIPLFADECNQQTVQRKFAEVTETIGALGLSEVSRFDSAGNPDSNNRFPFKIWFEPNQELRALWPETREYNAEGAEVPFYEQLKEVQDGDVMFRVMAMNHPDDPQRFNGPSRVDHIANIRLTSEMLTSPFGDTRLYFQHEDMKKDFDDEPKFKHYVDRVDRATAWNDTPIPFFPDEEDEEGAEAFVRGSIVEFGCPFAWLLNKTITPLAP